MLTKEGLILKTIPYQEQAKIAFVLTSRGKESFIIRGASKIKSSNRALSQVLNLIAFSSTEGKGIPTITESKLLCEYENLKSDYDKMQSVYPILEKLLALSEQITQTETLYEFAKKILLLMSSSPHHASLRNLFDLKLTYLAGIGPNFLGCTRCGSTEAEFLSAEDGGVICRSCKDPSTDVLSHALTELIKVLYLVKTDKVSDSLLEVYSPFDVEIERWIDDYYSRYLGFQSASKRVLRRMNEG